MSIPMHNANDVDLEPFMRIKIPSLATRRAACTHMTMDRLYGTHQCDVCRQPSLLGWVYICTQDANHEHTSHTVDENRDAAILESVEENDTIQEKSSFDFEPDHRMPTPELAPGVEKAIEDDQYSPEQALLLRAQKRKVVELANATMEQFELETRIKETLCRPSLVRSNRTIEGGTDSARNPDSTSTVRLRLFPYCKFQACQSCRPTYRDRAWQKFEEVYAKDASMVIGDENFNLDDTRPLISRKIIQDIGRRSLSQSILSPLDAVTLEPQDITDTNSQYEAEARSFRNSMRRRFLKGLGGRDGPLSGKKRRLNWEPKTSLDTEFWKALDDRLLQEAATLPLPEQDITDGVASKVDDIDNGKSQEGYLEMGRS